MKENLPWKGEKEKTLKNINNFKLRETHNLRRPDAYLQRDKTLLLLDYTRGHARFKEQLDKRKTEKETQYSEMLQDLRDDNPDWTIKLLVLHVSYGAAIDIDHWE